MASLLINKPAGIQIFPMPGEAFVFDFRSSVGPPPSRRASPSLNVSRAGSQTSHSRIPLRPLSLSNRPPSPPLKSIPPPSVREPSVISLRSAVSRVSRISSLAPDISDRLHAEDLFRKAKIRRMREVSLAREKAEIEEAKLRLKVEVLRKPKEDRRVTNLLDAALRPCSSSVVRAPSSSSRQQGNKLTSSITGNFSSRYSC
jgi:hypothetical protein